MFVITFLSLMQNTELVKKNIDTAVTSTIPEVPQNFENMIEKPCDNCHQPLIGPFCGQCGQQAESTLKYFWVVIMHLLDDIFSFDSRAARTILPLITRPAFLTNEYFAGRRVHYVPPLRLYLFISIIFFLSLNLNSNNTIFDENYRLTANNNVTEYLKELEQKKVSATDKHDELLIENINSDIAKYTQYQKALNNTNALLAAKVTEKIVELELKKVSEKGQLKSTDEKELNETIKQLTLINQGELKVLPEEKVTFSNNADGTLTFDFLSKENNDKLNDFVKVLEKKATKAFNTDPSLLMKESLSKLPQLMFIVLPIFAALLKVMYLFSNRLYMEHLTVALHSHSFIFLSFLIVEITNFLHDSLDKSSPLLKGIFEYTGYAALLWIPIYLFLMQKRVYKQGTFFTFVKYQLISMLYFMLLSFTAIIAFIWGLTDINL